MFKIQGSKSLVNLTTANSYDTERLSNGCYFTDHSSHREYLSLFNTTNNYLDITSLNYYSDNQKFNNENLLKFNFFHQLANDENLKKFPNFTFFPSNKVNLDPNNSCQYNGNSIKESKINNAVKIDNITVMGSNVNELRHVKAKKTRILFSQWQINELEKLFKKQKYVTSNERELMAKRLKLQANQVKIWFQNRRYKIKKQNELQKD